MFLFNCVVLSDYNIFGFLGCLINESDCYLSTVYDCNGVNKYDALNKLLCLVIC